MPTDPSPIEFAHTEDLAVTEYDAGRRVRLADQKDPNPDEALPTNDEAPKVGLSQKGDSEDAVVKRDTEI